MNLILLLTIAGPMGSGQQKRRINSGVAVS